MPKNQSWIRKNWVGWWHNYRNSRIAARAGEDGYYHLYSPEQRYSWYFCSRWAGNCFIKCLYYFNVCIHLIFCFLFYFQRLNVMATRAKKLLIVVGDHTTLCLNENWKELFNHCAKNNATMKNGRKMHAQVMFNWRLEIEKNN